LFIIPTSPYTRALRELEMLRSCINFNYVFYRNEASRTSQATFFDRVSGFWIFTRLMQSYRDGPMGTCNILHAVWNRKSAVTFYSIFYFSDKAYKKWKKKVSFSKFGNLSRHLDRNLSCPFRCNVTTIIYQ